MTKYIKIIFAACIVLAAATTSCTKDDKEKTLQSIEVTTQPDKKEYLVDEEFDMTGMVVTATYSDNSEKPVNVTDAMLDYDFSSAGEKTVTITYKSKTAEVTGITVTLAQEINWAANHIIITTEAQLRELAKRVNGFEDFTANSFENQTFVLANDIAVTGGDWTPIGFHTGTQVMPFEGTFDGNGKTVSDLIIKGNLIASGFFGWVGAKGYIKNLGVNVADYDVTTSWGNVNAGGLVGGNVGTIEKCFSTGDIKGGTTWVAFVFVGGLVGCNSGIITECYTTGNVHAFSPSVVYVGGLAGAIWGNATILEGKATIVNSYATGNVSVGNQGGLYMGGLVGDNGYNITTTIVENCYSTGNVSGTGSNAGGLVGVNRGAVTASYYDSETSGKSDTNRGEPKTTAEMKVQGTFEGWDFDDIWGINAGYPYLLME
jgi:hypothetical protein